MLVSLQMVSVLIGVLISVAFVTLVERNVLGALQRRVGPNSVGVWGLLQAFSDAVKLVVKETVYISRGNWVLIAGAPAFMLSCSLAGYMVVPFYEGSAVWLGEYGVLASLALSGFSVYSVLYAGWSSSNSFAFLGAVRSGAQMISYELSLSTCLLGVIYVSSSLSYERIMEGQLGIWYLWPMVPLVVGFLISAVAETNRTPFDLPEAESELVAGHMTEYSGMPFVLFFLAEYAALLLMSTLTGIIFMGGSYLVLKVWGMVFLYVWVRGTLPRLRYDQLMSFGWNSLLPISFGGLVGVIMVGM